MKSWIKAYHDMPTNVVLSIIFLACVYTIAFIASPPVMLFVTAIAGIYVSIVTILTWLVERKYK